MISAGTAEGCAAQRMQTDNCGAALDCVHARAAERELAVARMRAELVDRVCDQTRVETAKANERAHKRRVYHALSKADRKASNGVRHAARAQRHATESSPERDERLEKRYRTAEINSEAKR